MDSVFAKNKNSFNPQPTARNLTKPARMLRLGSSRLGVRLCIHVFRRLVQAGFAAQPTIERGESPDEFLISARDLLPLRLCTFASLRSFLPAAGSLREIHYPNSLTRGLPPRPPAPSPPAKALGARGGQAVWRFFVGWVKRALPRNPPSRMGNRQTPF